MKKGDLIFYSTRSGAPIYEMPDFCLRVVEKIDEENNNIVARKLTNFEIGSRKIKRIIKEMAK